MKALIIDDEAKARDFLQFLLETHIPEITRLKTCHGADQASEVLPLYHPDLVFLDIQMPHTDGFSWLKQLPKRAFTLIFTTAYNEYAIKAIRFAAFDYLLKPIDAAELRAAIDRLLVRRQLAEPEYEVLFYNASQPEPQKKRLALTTTEGTYYVKLSEILRCEAAGNYTYFHLNNGKRMIASRPIGVFEELLADSCFIRCHKSHLVNAHHVTRFSDQGLTLHQDIVVEISRRRRSEVKQQIATFMQTYP